VLVGLRDGNVVDPHKELLGVDALHLAEPLARDQDGGVVHIVWVGRVPREPLVRAKHRRLRAHLRSIDRSSDWHLHDIVITITVWCMAYKREVGEGVVY